MRVSNHGAVKLGASGRRRGSIAAVDDGEGGGSRTADGVSLRGEESDYDGSIHLIPGDALHAEIPNPKCLAATEQKARPF